MTEFRDLITSSPMEAKNQSEARFSFIQGGYVEDVEQQGALFCFHLFFGVQDEYKSTLELCMHSFCPDMKTVNYHFFNEFCPFFICF